MNEIQYLKDCKYVTTLQHDIKTSSAVHLCTVRLTKTVAGVFGDFLKRGGQLYVVTNSLYRWPEAIREVLDETVRLRTLGAHVTHYNSPYLLHSKLLTVSPDIVFLGSHNFTNQALWKNIERSVRIQNQQLYDTVVADIKQMGGGPLWN